MRWLIVCLICSFLVKVITTQDCSPCDCAWNWEEKLTVNCNPRNIGWNNLTKIPDTINKNANQLYFTHQAFIILKNNTFATFHNLTMINFGFNKIEIIERQTFKNLTKLTDLWLSNNNIQSLPDGIFHDLQQIQRIDLSDNSIAELPNNIFSNMSTLIKLWLYGNKLKTLPGGLFNDLRQIEVITLSKNCITELHKQLFSNLSTLKFLALQINKIKALPDGIFQNLQKIEEIYLNGNNITKLQKYLFSNLPRMRILDIADNKINTIEDESFSQLPTLNNRVDLRNNELKTIGINIIDNVQQLKYFDLSANPWHCDEDLCAVMDSVLHESTCRTPAEIEGKRWTQLLNTYTLDISNYTRDVEEGDTVYLECKHCFTSKIIWKFKNKRISRDHRVDISKKSLTSTLVLNNVTRDDSGYYSCHVQNCQNCQVVRTYLLVNYKTSNDKKYTVTDLVPTTSLVTQSTTTEDQGDASTNIPDLVPTTSLVTQSTTTEDQGNASTNSSTFLYLIVAVAVLIILIVIGILIYYRQKCRNH